jgi:hypothetical protein
MPIAKIVPHARPQGTEDGPIQKLVGGPGPEDLSGMWSTQKVHRLFTVDFEEQRFIRCDTLDAGPWIVYIVSLIVNNDKGRKTG